jgi:hypothetical protein
VETGSFLPDEGVSAEALRSPHLRIPAEGQVIKLRRPTDVIGE